MTMSSIFNPNRNLASSLKTVALAIVSEHPSPAVPVLQQSGSAAVSCASPIGLRSRAP